tara:strand:- start:7306 stop:7521 length:216 start_codon:yes stop_codon:yes gene_type:complete
MWLLCTLTSFPDDNSKREPPDPFPNSEVKPLSADGSVGFPHVRVGHRQVLSQGPTVSSVGPFYFYLVGFVA